MPEPRPTGSADGPSKTAAGEWFANSDRRIKTDVRDLDYPLSVIDRVRPVAFRYAPEYLAAHPSIEDVEYYNVIAQGYARVLPHSVKESGEKLASGESTHQVDVHPMQITAVAAVQPLHGILREKDTQIAELQAQNDSLSGRVKPLERAMQHLLAAQHEKEDSR